MLSEGGGGGGVGVVIGSTYRILQNFMPEQTFYTRRTRRLIEVYIVYRSSRNFTHIHG